MYKLMKFSYFNWNVASLVIVTVILVKYGITGLLEDLSKTGVLPNKNYVDLMTV